MKWKNKVQERKVCKSKPPKSSLCTFAHSWIYSTWTCDTVEDFLIHYVLCQQTLVIMHLQSSCFVFFFNVSEWLCKIQQWWKYGSSFLFYLWVVFLASLSIHTTPQGTWSLFKYSQLTFDLCILNLHYSCQPCGRTSNLPKSSHQWLFF